MRLPAEWEPQRLVIFTFPRSAGDWGENLHAASAAMITAANVVNKVTPVLMIVSDEEHFANYAEEYQGKKIRLPTNDCWIRDYGPITAIDKEGKHIMLDFTFNGWGGKYPAGADNEIPKRLHKALFPNHGYQQINLVLEGGSIESDGFGTMLTTTTCLLGQGRNNWRSPEAASQLLRKYFGKKTDVFWLTDGELVGDDTDAHIDTLARFLDERTIAYTSCDDPEDEHFESLREMRKDLRFIYTRHHKAFRLIALPLPPPIYAADGHRLPATYANFLISNGTIFLPTYFSDMPEDHPGKRADANAISVMQAYGKYKVVPVECRPFIEQHGSLHCLTMQVPA